MSRPYATDEQYERWFMADCARCGRHRNTAGSWPDGHVCRTCLNRAVRTRGLCPGCGQDRALPGRRPDDGAAICTTCAGFSQSFACSRCGFEDTLRAGRLCTRCTLADRLTGLLDDGTGRIRPTLVPLAELLLTMDNPRSGLSWIEKSPTDGASDLLRRLGRGEITLTHEAFHGLQPWRAAAHLRELLMACGALPALDKQICSFERWLTGHLAGIADPQHVQVIRRFATWQILPRLRAGAQTGPLKPSARSYAGDEVKHATSFLHWLDEHDLTLATCRQGDIDAWHVEHHEYARQTVRAFLLWCMTSKLTRRFRLPTAAIRQATPLPPHQRVALLGRVLTGRDLPLRSRVAAAIVLLYAQPVSRIACLTIDDITRDGDQVLLHLGEPPSPVPGQVADLLLEWTAHRSNTNTATNHDSRWLFPGRRAGQPMTPNALAALVHDLGVPTVAGRTAAIRQLVLEMPAPVVADALGYGQATTTRLAAQAGGTWNRYAPGDHHLRSPSGWTPTRALTTLE